MFTKINKNRCRELFSLSYLFLHPVFGLYALARNFYYTCKYLNRLNYLSWKFGDKRYQPYYGLQIGKYIFDMPDYPSFRGQWEEIMNNHIYQFQNENVMPIILDFGANIGVSVAYFKQLYPQCKIEAYEADPQIFYYLKKNIQQNLLENVVLHNQAVWIQNGKISFSADGADGGKITNSNESGKMIDCVDVLDIIQHYKQIDMLKMDVEGAEFQILKRLDNHISHVKHCFIEYHSAPDDQNFPSF